MAFYKCSAGVFLFLFFAFPFLIIYSIHYRVLYTDHIFYSLIYSAELLKVTSHELFRNIKMT